MKLKEELRGLLSKTAVIMGMGNEMRADDGAGAILARRLLKDLDHSQRITVISAGSSPENYIRNVLASQPDAIILVDAAETGGRPGEISFHDAESLSAACPSTHSISPGMIMKMLSFSSPAKIRLLAIQPKSLTLNGEVSAEVKKAIDRLAKLIVEAAGQSQQRSNS